MPGSGHRDRRETAIRSPSRGSRCPRSPDTEADVPTRACRFDHRARPDSRRPTVQGYDRPLARSQATADRAGESRMDRRTRSHTNVQSAGCTTSARTACSCTARRGSGRRAGSGRSGIRVETLRAPCPAARTRDRPDRHRPEMAASARSSAARLVSPPVLRRAAGTHRSRDP